MDPGFSERVPIRKEAPSYYYRPNSIVKFGAHKARVNIYYPRPHPTPTPKNSDGHVSILRFPLKTMMNRPHILLVHCRLAGKSGSPRTHRLGGTFLILNAESSEPPSLVQRMCISDRKCSPFSFLGSVYTA